jgi:hypothetical protein
VQGGAGDDAFNVQFSSASTFNGLTLNGGGGNDGLTMTDVEGGAVIRNLPSGANAGAIGLGFVSSKTLFHYLDMESVVTGVTLNQNFGQALYHRILGRNATPTEISSFLQVLQQKGARAVVKSLELSTEARQHKVNGWFQQYAGRLATAAELDRFAPALLHSSEEHVLGQILGLTHSNGPAVSNAQYVRDLYQGLLGSAPTSQQFAQTLAVLQKSGRAAAAQQVQETPAYRTLVIQNYFQTLLGRAATADELQSLVNSKKDLRAIRLDLESSAEYMNNGF